MTQQYAAGQPDQTSIEYVRRQVLDQITWAFDRLEKANTLAEPVTVDRRSINTPEAAIEIARPLLDGADQELTEDQYRRMLDIARENIAPDFHQAIGAIPLQEGMPTATVATRQERDGKR